MIHDHTNIRTERMLPLYATTLSMRTTFAPSGNERFALQFVALVTFTPATLTVVMFSRFDPHKSTTVPELPTAFWLFEGHEPDNTGVYRFLNAMEDRDES